MSRAVVMAGRRGAGLTGVRGHLGSGSREGARRGSGWSLGCLRIRRVHRGGPPRRLGNTGREGKDACQYTEGSAHGSPRGRAGLGQPGFQPEGGAGRDRSHHTPGRTRPAGFTASQHMAPMEAGQPPRQTAPAWWVWKHTPDRDRAGYRETRMDTPTGHLAPPTPREQACANLGTRCALEAGASTPGETNR
jgi:hypothetical protein